MNKLPLQDKIINYFKNNYILLLIWILIVFLSSIITITEGISLLTNIYKTKVIEKQILYGKLNSLAPGLQIDYYTQILGVPAIIKRNNDKTQKEYIYVNKYFYVQAITRDDGYVLSYAITTRDRKFKPTFKAHGYTDSFNREKFEMLSNKETDTANDTRNFKNSIIKGKGITLNKTTFAEVVTQNNLLDSKVMCKAYIGAHRFNYSEEIYLANPGNYQTMIVGINDAGNTDSAKYIGELFNIFFNGDADQESCSGVPYKHRLETKINTFIITAPYIEGKDIKDFTYGVNLLDVRVFE